MIVIITKYGRSPLRLAYNDQLLKRVVDEFLKDIGTSFKYSELYNYVVDRAMREDGFVREPYTRYTDIVLTEYDEHRLSMILWQKIWNRELVMEFRNIYPHKQQDTVFGVVNRHQ